MAILHLVRCDACGTDTPMMVGYSGWTLVGTGTLAQQMAPVGATYSIPSTVKQIDGKHFCSWACVANYAETQQGAPR